jgi:hypothetical protein
MMCVLLSRAWRKKKTHVVAKRNAAHAAAHLLHDADVRRGAAKRRPAQQRKLLGDLAVADLLRDGQLAAGAIAVNSSHNGAAGTGTTWRRRRCRRRCTHHDVGVLHHHACTVAACGGGRAMTTTTPMLHIEC